MDLFLQLKGVSVGYCHKDHGCKMAYQGLRGANGIAEGPDGLIFVANNVVGQLYVLEKEDDKTLVLTNTLKLPVGQLYKYCSLQMKTLLMLQIS